MLHIRPSTRNRAKIKLALQGCAGSGKTYSALLLAYGMTSDWSKIAVIDSENGSADLYAHLGAYNVVSLGGDYSPENYIEAITLCENAGMEVIIVDSISQCWDYLLDFHAGLQGNSFANWAKVTPRQNAFVQKILQSEVHIICTMRTKQDYVLNEKNGKMVPEKVGLKAMQRDGMDYEFTVVLDIDLKHHVQASKDRTGLFMGRPRVYHHSPSGPSHPELVQPQSSIKHHSTPNPSKLWKQRSDSIPLDKRSFLCRHSILSTLHSRSGRIRPHPL